VNPAGVEAQPEGGAVYGLSAALHGELTLREGRVQQGPFNEYGVLRLSEMPHVEVFIVPSTEKPGGVGEPGVPTAAPAPVDRQVRRDGLSSRAYLPPFEPTETSAT
jgi:isoquinoline 1-oxidoreductase beta subunit